MLLRFKDEIINAAHIERIQPIDTPAFFQAHIYLFSGHKIVLENDEARCLVWLVDKKLLGVPTLDIATAIKARPEIDKQLAEQRAQANTASLTSGLLPDTKSLTPDKIDEIMDLLQKLGPQKKDNAIPFPKR